MTIADLAPWYQGRIILPVLGKVTATRYTDRVQVRLVSGQSAADFAKHADEPGPRVRRPAVPGPHRQVRAVLLEFVRRDALAAIVPALPDPRPSGPQGAAGRAPRGRLPWLVKLHGTHVLIAGATGAGKASLLWGAGPGHVPADAAPGWSGCWPLTRS